jgi:hypothetical protein
MGDGRWGGAAEHRTLNVESCKTTRLQDHGTTGPQGHGTTGQ